MKYSEQEIKDIANLDSRKAVGYAIEKLHKHDEKIVCVYADVGSRFSVKGKLGNNEIEIGIAEQTLIPMLGGLYHEGYIPFGIAYAPFITMRAADQIRMTVGQMKLGIKLVGGSAGLVSGNLGAASLALDDMAMMRAIPNMTILSPSDCLSEVKLFEYAATHDEPVYIRLTGNVLNQIYKTDDIISNKQYALIYDDGDDAVVYCTGAITYQVMKAAEILSQKGIHIKVIDMLFIKPINKEILRRYADINNVFTVEEHSIIGGLGSAVSDFISENTNQRLHRIGIKDSYLFPDSYENLLAVCSLNAIGLVESISKALEKSPL